jgi:RNA polymerase sigma-70 factor (ECF subfamily)
MEDDAPGHEASVDSVVVLLAQPVSPRARGSHPPPIPVAHPRTDAAEPAVIPAFEVVYDQNFAFVWRCLRRLGVPDRLLDDAAQDVFIVVHRRLGEFEGRSSLKSWLFAIARRVAHDHRRRVGRKERTEELPETLADTRASTPAHDAERAQAVRVLYEILGGLDDDKREVFVLAELEQMTVPEIADAIGANVNTVYSRLRAARQGFEAAVARRLARQGGQP